MEDEKVLEQETKEVKSVEKYKDKVCKVLFYLDGVLGVEFDGNGISFEVDKPASDTVIISYCGEYGKENFKFKLK